MRSSYGVTGPAEDTGTRAGIDFRRQGISLSGTAITATVIATLPGGTGVAYDAAETVLGRTLSQSAAQLNASLVPTDTISFSGGPYFIHEETKPLIVECSSIQWDTATAVFTLMSPTPHPTRRPFLDALNVAMGQPAGTQLKVSNDHYWNAVTGLSGALIARQADGSGALSITATLGSGSMKAHFPETNTFSFTGGTVVLEGAKIAVSVAAGPAPELLLTAVPFWKVTLRCRDVARGLVVVRSAGFRGWSSPVWGCAGCVVAADATKLSFGVVSVVSVDGEPDSESLRTTAALAHAAGRGGGSVVMDAGWLGLKDGALVNCRSCHWQL